MSVVEPKAKQVHDRYYRSNNPPPQYYQQAPPGRVYYQQQQRVGGQKVYVIDDGGYPPPQPVDATRGPAYYRNQSDSDVILILFGDDDIDTKIRNRFVQKVYSILTTQLLFTFLFLILVTFEKNTRNFFRRNALVLMLISMMVSLVLMIIISCCASLRRNVAVGFTCLALLTLTMTCLMSVAVAFTPPIIVLMAVGITAGICTIVSVFACQTKWDITGCGMILLMLTLVLFLYGFIMMILMFAGIYNRIVDMVYSGLVCILFCAWLMYDTQQIVGGRRVELSAEEYILGALMLYVDIVQIFLSILNLSNSC